MTTSFIAMGVALFAVAGLVIGLGFLSLLVGGLEFIFGGPKLRFLKTEKGQTGFAFALNWNSAKEPASIDYIQMAFFDAFGKMTQKKVSVEFDGEKHRFAKDVDFGNSVKEIWGSLKSKTAQVEVELGSRKDGIFFRFPYRGEKFLKKQKLAPETVDSFNEKTLWNTNTQGKSPISAAAKTYIADTVPGKGPQIAIPSNPAFEAYFAKMGGGAGASSGGETQTQENFAVSKVWIEEGCIVCNACEDVYPEVFDVQAEGCIVRPGAPLDDGLKIIEAVDSCPVEIIKFTKA